jgi:hypothetical protein
VVLWVRLDDFDGEFSGGGLIGPLFYMAVLGSILFLTAFQKAHRTTNCHPEGRDVCGPKDLNIDNAQHSAAEILRRSFSDRLRIAARSNLELENGPPQKTFPAKATADSIRPRVLRFAKLADHADERLHAARQAAIAAIDQRQFAPQVHAIDVE